MPPQEMGVPLLSVKLTVRSVEAMAAPDMDDPNDWPTTSGVEQATRLEYDHAGCASSGSSKPARSDMGFRCCMCCVHCQRSGHEKVPPRNSPVGSRVGNVR